jgi:FkbM family methyltransferase
LKFAFYYSGNFVEDHPRLAGSDWHMVMHMSQAIAGSRTNTNHEVTVYSPPSLDDDGEPRGGALERGVWWRSLSEYRDEPDLVTIVASDRFPWQEASGGPKWLLGIGRDVDLSIADLPQVSRVICSRKTAGVGSHPKRWLIYDPQAMSDGDPDYLRSYVASGLGYSVMVWAWERASRIDRKQRSADNIRGTPYLAIDCELYDSQPERESRERWLDLKPGDVFLDIGCASGSWSIPAAALGATVVSVDCGSNMARIREAVAINKFQDRVTLIVGFVCNEDATEESRVNVMERGCNTGLLESQWPSIVNVWGGRIDEICSTRKILDKVTMMKMDIEAFEMDGIRGAAEMIKASRPRMMIEVHGTVYPDKVVTLEDVTGLIDSIVPGYKYESQQHNDYWHLYCEIPAQG